MRSRNKVIGVFIIIILMIFLYGIGFGYLYNYKTSTSNGAELLKNSFIDLYNQEYDINNRALTEEDEKLRLYKTSFTRDFLEKQSKTSGHKNHNWYLMIEKPDAQHFEVWINDQLIDQYGDTSGKSNLWNSIFISRVSDELIQEDNELVITMYSDYMTGVAGRIILFSEHDFKIIDVLRRMSEDMVKSAFVVAMFAGIILLMMIIAWRDQLFNINAYIFFLISIIALGITLLDHRELAHLFMSYYTFKKVIILSYHIAITFVGLGIAYLINARHKWNIGMISLLIMAVQSFLAPTLIAYREWYATINGFLVIATIQIMIILIYYRKRAKLGSCVLLIGFALAGVTVAKLVFITSTLTGSSMLIDLPVLIIIYVTIVLFLLYLEMIQVVSDYDVDKIDDVNDMGITGHMQGSFTIDESHSVVGPYGTACDHIFNRHIIGERLVELLELPEEENKFLSESLEMFFDPKYSFKEGFIALLPEKLTINNRLYQVNYNGIERPRLLLRITLSDITRFVELEGVIDQERKIYNFVINALKFRQEIGYFIESTQLFFKRLKLNGFTPYYQGELHTLKGNLGQLGFFQFEQCVHEVEESLLKENYDAAQLIEILEQSFQRSVALLYKYIEPEYLQEGYDQLSITKEDIFELEESYQQMLEDSSKENDFKMRLMELRYVDLKEMFKRYIACVSRLGQETQKSILPLQITGESIKVNPEKAENVLRVLVAIFRNAIVHGIEMPEERTMKNKDSFGQIYCRVILENQWIHISIGDDGQGIDKDFIVKKALQYGMIGYQQSLKMTAEEKLNLIFESGMSRLEDADILAGRGIGLYTVREVIRKMGGDIQVTTRKNQGSEFNVFVPITELRMV